MNDFHSKNFQSLLGKVLATGEKLTENQNIGGDYETVTAAFGKLSQDLRATVTSYEEEMARLNAALEAKLSGLAGGHQAGVMAQQTVKDQEKIIEELNQQMGQLRASYEERILNLEREIEGLKDMVGSRDQLVQRHAGDVEHLEGKIREYESLVAQKKQHMEELGAEIGKLQSKLERALGKHELFQNILDKQKEAIAAYQQENEELRALLRQLQGEAEEMRSLIMSKGYYEPAAKEHKSVKGFDLMEHLRRAHQKSGKPRCYDW